MKRILLLLFDLAARTCGLVYAAGGGFRIRHVATLFLNRAFSHAIRRQFRRFGAGAQCARNAVLINPRFVSVGARASVGERTTISAWDWYGEDRFSPAILIGDGTSIGSDCHITAIDRIDIGNGVLTGKRVTITDNSHGPTTGDQVDIAPVLRRLVSKGPVVIEDNVWIGEKATILPGVRVGRGAIVAANAVVASDVPCGCIVAGIPARVVRCMIAPEPPPVAERPS